MVVALAKLGRFPVDLVRALLDEGEGIVLLLAKAANCSWITTKHLLLMYAAKRNLTPDDLSQAFERFNRLTPETAQRVVRFHERRVKRRVEEQPPQTSTAKKIVKAGAGASTAMPNQTARPAPDTARASLETTI